MNLGEPLNQLPVDKLDTTEEEKYLISSIFGQKKDVKIQDVKNIVTEIKDIFIIGLLYLLSNIEYVDNILEKYIHTSKYVLICIKGIIVGIFYWLIKNYYLSRNR